MSNRLLVRGARQMLTLRGNRPPRRGTAMRELGILENAALLIEDGMIREVGPARRVENLSLARRAREVDATGCVVMPGFVDSHTHLVCGPPRLADYASRLEGKSYQEIAKGGGGILWSMRAVRSWTARRLEHEARRVLREMALCGTTTVEAKSGYGLELGAELKQLKVARNLDEQPIGVVSTCLGAHTTPPEFAGKNGEYIDWCAKVLLPEVAKRKLARYADVYCDEGAFTLEQAQRYLGAAARLGLGLRVHASQFRNLGAVQLAAAQNAASVDHLEAAGADEIRALARSNTVATLLPGSVLHLGRCQYAPARALIDEGAAVALATDYNPGTSPVRSMQAVISLACSQMRMTPAEAITAATINGAQALGLADRCGSLEAGKQADLLVLECSDYRELPYYFGGNQVRMTLRKGVILQKKEESHAAQAG